MSIPEGEISKILSYWGLKEIPTKSRDFVHSEKVLQMIEEVKAGQNIRLLGEAGVGKSATLRELKVCLEEKIDDKYLVVPVELPWLVGKLQKYLTHEGFAVLCRELCDALDDYSKRGGSLPVGTGGLKSKIDESINKVSEPERYYYLRKLCEKARDDGIKIVVTIDDCDPLQHFDDFNNVNSLADLVHSIVFAYKPSEEKAMMRKGKREDQTITELSAQKERLEAFLRRSSPINLEGQTALATWKIARGKIGKKTDLLTDAAWAYGFAAAYCGESQSGQTLDFYAPKEKNISDSVLFFNPDRIGYFIWHCLVLGYNKKVKQIGEDIAKEAYHLALKGKREYARIDVKNIAVYSNEYLRAKKELNKELKKSKKT